MLPPFYSQKFPAGATQNHSFGGSLNFQLPRESHIERIDLWIDGVIGTGSATAAIEGLSRMVDSVSLRGSLPGEAQFEPINGLSGPDLFEYAQYHAGSLPRVVGGLTTTARFRVAVPIYFRDFGFDAQRNLLSAIPAVRMSDLTLSVRLATQAQLDTNATPTLAFTGTPVVGVDVHQFYRDTVPANWPFLRTSYEVQQDDSIVTNTDREIRLPAGGDYDRILIRSYNAANVKQLDTAGAPFTQNGKVRIDDLSLLPKEQTTYQNLRDRNLSEIVDSLVNGNACFIFGKGAGGLFQTGVIGKSLNYVKLTYNSTANSGALVRFVYRRFFDPQNLLGIPR